MLDQNSSIIKSTTITYHTLKGNWCILLVSYLNLSDKQINIAFFECSFEKWIVSFAHSDSPELGNFGEPAFLSDDEKNIASEIYSKKAMNVALSNKISLRRKLLDVRDPL